MICSNSSMPCDRHRHAPKAHILFWSAASTAVLGLAWILYLISTPATIFRLPWQIPPEPGLGTPVTLPLVAHSLLPPAARDFRLSPPNGLDAEWPLRWKWHGFSRRGLKWQTTLAVWAHAPGNRQGNVLTFLPTPEKIPLPDLAVVLPAGPALPVWTEPSAPDGTSAANSQGPRRLATGLLALAVATVTAALVLSAQKWHNDAPIRKAIKSLPDSRHPLAADAILAAVVAFFTHRRRPPPGRDLLRLADSLARGNGRDALLAPSLRVLAHSLNIARFSPCQPQDELLASCHRLACFIIRYYR